MEKFTVTNRRNQYEHRQMNIRILIYNDDVDEFLAYRCIDHVFMRFVCNTLVLVLEMQQAQVNHYANIQDIAT